MIAHHLKELLEILQNTYIVLLGKKTHDNLSFSLHDNRMVLAFKKSKVSMLQVKSILRLNQYLILV